MTRTRSKGGSRAPDHKPPDGSPPKGARPGFPFTAIVGQEELKLGILLAVIDPAIGGILITGHRGTAKSTAVRALAELLPSISVTRDCPYRCDPAGDRATCPSCSTHDRERVAVDGPVPVVDLPLGATEDRVVGSVDIERALVEGVQAFSPGLLAAAHRGFLYIDEVNLLEDHLVDLLLDVAVSGINVVEREGLSLRHPARFVLVGSGNPEEGDLRPQLLDRFGLHAKITTLQDIGQRVEIVRRRLAFETDPTAFVRRFAKQQAKLREQLRAAISRRKSVQLSDGALELAARLCDRLAIDGHRGELALSRAAVALAAFEGRDAASADDVSRVAALALAHRLRKDPLEPAADEERVRRVLSEALSPAPH
ncbi:MAG: magnesium chelatase ATPase subunit I [Steroidobacteraceae bacterium]